MAYVFNPPTESKRRVSFEGAEKEIWNFIRNRPFWPDGLGTSSWYKGLPLPAELMPKVLYVMKGDRPEDYDCAVGGVPIVSEKFKLLLESIDPNRHQFFDISVIDKQGSLIPERYYIFNVVGEIDSIIEEQSDLKALGRGEVDRWCYQRAGDWKCAMDSRIISGRAFWAEYRLILRWCISDKMESLLRNNGINSYSVMDHCDEI